MEEQNLEDIYREYKEIVRDKQPAVFVEGATNPKNTPKNRYGDVLPLATTAVKLQRVDGQEDSDYINANYVYDDLNNELSKRQLYICCQAPLVSTFDDFWRMTWEQNVPIIVMITNLVEKNRVKADPYWPSCVGQVVRFGDICVKLVKQQTQSKSITVRSFRIWRKPKPTPPVTIPEAGGDSEDHDSRTPSDSPPSISVSGEDSGEVPDGRLDESPPVTPKGNNTNTTTHNNTNTNSASATSGAQQRGPEKSASTYAEVKKEAKEDRREKLEAAEKQAALLKLANTIATNPDPARIADLSASSTKIPPITTNTTTNDSTTATNSTATSAAQHVPDTRPQQSDADVAGSVGSGSLATGLDSSAGETHVPDTTALSNSKKAVRGIPPMPQIVITTTNSAADSDNVPAPKSAGRDNEKAGDDNKSLSDSGSNVAGNRNSLGSSHSGHHHHHHVHVSSTAINAGQPIMSPDTASNPCCDGVNSQPSPKGGSPQHVSNTNTATSSGGGASTNSKDLLDDGSGQILSPWRRNSLYNSFSQLVQSQKVTYEKNYRRDQIDSDSQRSQSEQSELDKATPDDSFEIEDYQSFSFSASTSSEEEEEKQESEEGEVREIAHLHCTNWPDFGIPDSTQEMINLINELDIRKKSLDDPVVVHCSAGIGRTGTFVAIHMCLNRCLLGLDYDIKKIVKHLRTQRLGMVQSKEQYSFVYSVTKDIIQAKTKELESSANSATKSDPGEYKSTSKKSLKTKASVGKLMKSDIV